MNNEQDNKERQSDQSAVVDVNDEILRKEMDAAMQSLKKRVENNPGVTYIPRRRPNPLLSED